MYKIFCRIYQRIFKLATYFLSWKTPELLEGENSLRQLAAKIKAEGLTNMLIITDKGISNLGLMNDLLEDLEREDIKFNIYDQTVANPTIDNIEEALHVYRKHECEGIIAFGGGSPIDCAKGVAARVARPNKTISQMKGLLKVRKEIPPLIVVPTTAGTGSETTLAAVVSNSETNEKYPIMDPALFPKIAVLDPLLIVNLPAHITSTTGMDALTHAVEAYIGKSNTRDTRKFSIEATKLIYDNLYVVYSNGKNIEARFQMQKAAFFAGAAFTRAYVGNVHAIAHTLGGFYNVPHGLANAVILPYVLDYYGSAVHKPLSELADVLGLSKADDSIELKARAFIDWIKELNQSMNIPNKIAGIKEKDIPIMVERAFKEANPLYPVPKILTKEDFTKLYYMIKE